MRNFFVGYVILLPRGDKPLKSDKNSLISSSYKIERGRKLEQFQGSSRQRERNTLNTSALSPQTTPSIVARRRVNGDRGFHSLFAAKQLMGKAASPAKFTWIAGSFSSRSVTMSDAARAPPQQNRLKIRVNGRFMWFRIEGSTDQE